MESLKKKLILSKNVKLLSIDQLNDNELIKELGYVYFIKIKNYKIITISQFMREVLLFFKEESSIQNFLLELKKDMGFIDKNLNESILHFIKKMIKLGVLVTNEHNKHFILSQAENLKPGTLVDNYVLKDLIVVNNKAAIFKACHKNKNEHKVILKFLISESGQFQFKNELKALSSISEYKNIRRMLDQGEWKDLKYLVLEYINGERLCKTSMNYDLPKKIDLCRQLVSGVCELHNLGFIHGDIHSSNFLIQDDSIVKLIDLGMTTEMNNLSSGKNHGGTPHFMPPERIDDDGIRFSKASGDFRAEIFQVGLILYEIIYDKRPFDGILWKDLAKSILEDEPIFSTHTFKNEKVSNKLKGIIKKCLEKKPEDRFVSMKDLLTNLNSLLNEK